MSDSSIFQRLFSLENKVALVTGASGGIGSALAFALAEAGADVALHHHTAEPTLKLRQRIEALGRRACVFRADVSDVSACHALIAKTQQQLGRLDILVNCAGTNRRKPIAAVVPDDFESIVNVNLRSVLFLCQAAHVIMRAQGGGKIINIGSMSSLQGLGNISVYGATKAAIAQLTKTMAIEWAVANIQVNCLAPGFIHTPLTAQALWGDTHIRQWLLERIPAKRAGYPDDLIGVTLLLASSASNYLTGQVIAVDGGFLAGGSWSNGQ